MERANCAVGGDFETEDAAIAEENQGAAGLVDGAVSGEEYVGVEKIFVG